MKKSVLNNIVLVPEIEDSPTSIKLLSDSSQDEERQSRDLHKCRKKWGLAQLSTKHGEGCKHK